MRKISISALIVLGLFASCKKETVNVNAPENSALSIEKIYDSESNLKRAFGKALLASMKESPMLRALIKAEALKMFDKDYEVLYFTIKDNQLENGLTVEQMITKHLEGNGKLNEILNKFPTLTILVPELPENAFSAKLWNTNDVIPAVAVRTDKHNDVPYIKTDGTEEVMPAKYTPGFPIIVVGINERVIANTTSNDFDNYKTRIVYDGNGVKLRFWADGFDNKDGKMVDRNANIGGILTLDQKVIDAYNIYKNVDGWQRDYIYYGIKPTTPNGEFKYNFMEHLRAFQVGTAANAIASFNYIADQADEVPDTYSSLPNASYWSQGAFEFKVKAKINGKNGMGDDVVAGFSVSPTNLFAITFGQVSGHYYISNLTPKEVLVDLPLFSWKLEDLTPSVKIAIEEVDLPQTVVSTESRTSTYASNFGIDAGFDLFKIIKLGIKFGSSNTTTTTKSVQTSTTMGSDDLYEAIVNFADNVVVSDKVANGRPGVSDLYVTRQYSTGKVSFSLEPKKVQ